MLGHCSSCYVLFPYLVLQNAEQWFVVYDILLNLFYSGYNGAAWTICGLKPLLKAQKGVGEWGFENICVCLHKFSIAFDGLGFFFVSNGELYTIFLATKHHSAFKMYIDSFRFFLLLLDRPYNFLFGLA